MSLDRQPAAAAERRRPEWTIHAIRPPSTRAPSSIHSQMRLDPELLPDAATPEAVAGPGVVTPGADGWAGGVAVTVVVLVAVTGTPVVAVTVTLGRAEAVAVLLGK